MGWRTSKPITFIMKKVFICSRLRGNLDKNINRAKSFSRLAVMKGFIPFTPHIYFTLFLDDNIKSEREIGINAGLEWIKLCHELWILDKNISAGMKKEIEFAKSLNKKIVIMY